MIVAHRGGASENAEGALESLESAARQGFAVEFDLRALADGAWAVAHDADVSTLLKGRTGPVAELTTAQWKAACILGPGDTCGTPAVWDDVLRSIPANTLLVPEIKQGTIDPVSMIAAVKNSGRADNIIVQTFRLREAEQLAAAGVHTLYLATAGTSIDVESVARAGIEYIGVNQDADSAIVERAHRAGLRVWVWTVNTNMQATRWSDAGADGLFTDEPVRLSTALKE